MTCMNVMQRLTQSTNTLQHIPGTRRTPRPTRTGSVGFHVDQSRLVHVHQLGHLELFFAVLCG